MLALNVAVSLDGVRKHELACAVVAILGGGRSGRVRATAVALLWFV